MGKIQPPTASQELIIAEMSQRFSDNYSLNYNGNQNLVIAYAGQAILRLPYDETGARVQQFEAALLEQLQVSPGAPPLAIPRIIEHSQNPAYMLYDYLPGTSSTESEIRQCDPEKQIEIGKVLANFLHWTERALSGEDLTGLPAVQAQLEIIKQRDNDMLRTLRSFDDADYPTLTAHARSLAATHSQRYPRGVQADSQARLGHNDIHMRNILFDDEQRPQAVIDFANTTSTVLERDLRYIFSVGDVMLTACIAEFETLSGRTANYDDIRLWATTDRVVNICQKIANGVYSKNYGYALDSRQKLSLWQPELDWTELTRQFSVDH